MTASPIPRTDAALLALRRPLIRPAKSLEKGGFYRSEMFLLTDLAGIWQRAIARNGSPNEFDPERKWRLLREMKLPACAAMKT